VCCSVLQRGVNYIFDTIVRYELWNEEGVRKVAHILGNVLQCVAVCCSMLQYVTVCCRVLQGVAGCCSLLQRLY